MHGTTRLVVEDNTALRKRLSILLRVNGYEVLFAEDAISATAALMTERPDLILDLGLPRGDVDVMERIAQKRPTHSYSCGCADRAAKWPVTGIELCTREQPLSSKSRWKTALCSVRFGWPSIWRAPNCASSSSGTSCCEPNAERC